MRNTSPRVTRHLVDTREANVEKTTELTITQMPIGELRPDPANPRRISEDELESLTRSIGEFGLIDPIIARKEDHVVIGDGTC